MAYCTGCRDTAMYNDAMMMTLSEKHGRPCACAKMSQDLRLAVWVVQHSSELNGPSDIAASTRSVREWVRFYCRLMGHCSEESRIWAWIHGLDTSLAV